ncbi:hypothetical protein [Pantoea sp. CCBC3-3-1]|uniref:hypothetical protein n=1 Tax=Pantoea sp. CCBC3-3-1 TaxID=2490851 RepID=UPI00143CE92C|nr:hypothetical protein [Pantoea sp. CCBC3-3-1]
MMITLLSKLIMALCFFSRGVAEKPFILHPAATTLAEPSGLTPISQISSGPLLVV